VVPNLELLMQTILGASFLLIGGAVVLGFLLDMMCLMRSSAKVVTDASHESGRWTAICSRGHVSAPLNGQLRITRASGRPSSSIQTTSLTCIVVAFDRDHLSIVYPAVFRSLWKVLSRSDFLDMPPLEVHVDGKGAVRLVGGPLGSRIYLGRRPDPGFVENLLESGWAIRV
jgi:hypothetical protein